MTSDASLRPVSLLRARIIEDMTVRGFNEYTRRDYIRHVRSFAAVIAHSPDTPTAEDLRLFQLHQTRIGMQPPSINSSVSALGFFLTVTADRPAPTGEQDGSLSASRSAIEMRTPATSTATASCCARQGLLAEPHARAD